MFIFKGEYVRIAYSPNTADYMRIYHKYPSFHTLNTKSNSSVTHKAIAALIITCQCAYENLKRAAAYIDNCPHRFLMVCFYFLFL